MARYIELNPGCARLVKRAEAWPWSSAKTPLKGAGDGLTEIAALGINPHDWHDFRDGGLDRPTLEAIRGGERTGRPLGTPEFVSRLEAATGRELARRKPGPKPKANDAGQAEELDNVSPELSELSPGTPLELPLVPPSSCACHYYFSCGLSSESLFSKCKLTPVTTITKEVHSP